MRVLIADDHDLVRDSLAAFMENEGFTIESAATLADAIRIVQETPLFDVILLDYTMPGMNGLEGLDRMRHESNDRPVAIISGTASKNIADQALQNGARGFIPKSLPAKSMVNAVRFIAAGETYVPVSFLDAEADAAAKLDLTTREVQVLHGICEGKSNKEIAIDHDLQEVTVKLHVKTLLKKMDAKNRTHAAMIARGLQLI